MKNGTLFVTIIGKVESYDCKVLINFSENDFIETVLKENDEKASLRRSNIINNSSCRYRL